MSDKNENYMKLMEFRYPIATSLLLLCLTGGSAQDSTSNGQESQTQVKSTAMTKFDLDFPGGTPKQLISAIQKSSSKTLNAIIPEDFADTRLPSLKMKNVDVNELFLALSSASRTERYAFISQGKPSDTSIWTFIADRHSTPKACRFYALSRYLENGTSLDDITTAIKTGSQMLAAAEHTSDAEGPTISFHKDTKLLIAVGEPRKLEIIDSVLKALVSQLPRPVGHLRSASSNVTDSADPAKAEPVTFEDALRK